VLTRSRFRNAALIAALSACGGTPREASRPIHVVTPAPEAQAPDPDLNRPPPTKLVAIDWTKVAIKSDSEAMALWQQIAPTGEDWEAKLDEIPTEGPIASQLALALLRDGNFTCRPARTGTCTGPAQDIEPPSPAATLSDPCLRRMLALWALSALDDADVDPARDALRAITDIPPPESQLVDAALDVIPETDQAGNLELRARAFAAGHRELVNGKLNTLDDAQLIDAVQKHHIDGPLDRLSATTHRALFLGAAGDELLAPSARSQAMIELAALSDEENAKLPRDVVAMLATATRSKDCSVAATAARLLAARGHKKLRPFGRRPRGPTR
jgi:hypothetical protein